MTETPISKNKSQSQIILFTVKFDDYYPFSKFRKECQFVEASNIQTCVSKAMDKFSNELNKKRT